MVQERVGEVSIGRRQQQGGAVCWIGKHETAIAIKDCDRRMQLAREVVHSLPGREIRGHVYAAGMTLLCQVVEFAEGMLDRMEVREVDIEAFTVETPSGIIEYQRCASQGLQQQHEQGDTVQQAACKEPECILRAAEPFAQLLKKDRDQDEGSWNDHQQVMGEDRQRVPNRDERWNQLPDTEQQQASSRWRRHQLSPAAPPCLFWSTHVRCLSILSHLDATVS